MFFLFKEHTPVCLFVCVFVTHLNTQRRVHSSISPLMNVNQKKILSFKYGCVAYRRKKKSLRPNYIKIKDMDGSCQLRVTEYIRKLKSIPQ